MLYFSALWQFLLVVAYNAEHFSALLPTMQKNFPSLCLLRRPFFHVIGNNAEKCSDFSSCVFFRVVAHNALSFRVVDHSMEILSALLPTTWKNGQRCWQQRRTMFEFDYFHEFETICEFTLGFQSGAWDDVRLMCFIKKI
jgi:hypothetical protein